MDHHYSFDSFTISIEPY